VERFSDNPVIYDAKLSWQLDPHVLAYAKYGTGYRAGGIGFRAAGTRFNPERDRAIEVGAKADMNRAGFAGGSNS